ADVTGDDAADLTIPGVIRDYAGAAYENMPMTKVGAGTVSFSGVNTHKGLITINQGALALDGNNSLNINNPIVLNGGALNIGDFANSAGTLTVSNTNSLLVVGAGSIAFADSSATTWVNKLTVTGPLQANSVRFGTSAGGLTAAQIAAIKINGERAALRADGYLTLAPSGTLITIR
ncbi:MAG: autotransporter-associated beta strand repeat-containing protein, partial [Kiritimatiellae bacterium]|nr:autotransporter-associated beta strand repeat-containing protein [Kiritimatiellia bacterium]